MLDITTKALQYEQLKNIIARSRRIKGFREVKEISTLLTLDNADISRINQYNIDPKETIYLTIGSSKKIDVKSLLELRKIRPNHLAENDQIVFRVIP